VFGFSLIMRFPVVGYVCLMRYLLLSFGSTATPMRGIQWMVIVQPAKMRVVRQSYCRLKLGCSHARICIKVLFLTVNLRGH
jgi:hypothetical protein